jgi:hypothetical protein
LYIFVYIIQQICQCGEKRGVNISATMCMHVVVVTPPAVILTVCMFCR